MGLASLRRGVRPAGRFGDAGRPSVLVYNHLDVQPADEPEWKGEPFRMRIDGERVVQRIHDLRTVEPDDADAIAGLDDDVPIGHGLAFHEST